MQSIFRLSPMRASLRTPLRTFSPLASRSLSTTTRLSIKEDKAQDPEELEATKQSQIQKQKEGKGHWHEELASAGEASIAADKQKVHDHDEHMEDLQKQTAKEHEKEHPHGKAD